MNNSSKEIAKLSRGDLVQIVPTPYILRDSYSIANWIVVQKVVSILDSVNIYFYEIYEVLDIIEQKYQYVYGFNFYFNKKQLIFDKKEKLE